MELGHPLSQRERFRQFVSGQSLERALPFPIAITESVSGAADKAWAGDIAYEEVRDVMLSCGCVPTITIGERDWLPPDHPMSLSPVVLSDDGERRHFEASVDTPFGRMAFPLVEHRGQSLTITGGPVERREDLNRVIWYIQALRDHTDAIREHIVGLRSRLGDDCLITFFLAQPYELFCIFPREDAIYLEIDYPDEFAVLQREILETVRALIRPAIDGGADVLFFGSVGTELYSPKLFRKHLLASSITYANDVRAAGGVSSFHMCGKGQTYLDMGVFDQIHVDIVEGAAPPPAGNVDSLARARAQTPDSTIIRGNIDLGCLLNASPDEVHQEALDQLAQVKGHRHIVSGACAILPGTPPANIRALGDACDEYNGRRAQWN
jgi:hypothetical protein